MSPLRCLIVVVLLAGCGSTSESAETGVSEDRLTVRKLSCWVSTGSISTDVDTTGRPRGEVTASSEVIVDGRIPETGFNAAHFQVAVEPDGKTRMFLSIAQVHSNRSESKAYAASEGLMRPDSPMKVSTKLDDGFTSVLCKITAPEEYDAGPSR